jgi:hypothetical protein
MWAYDDPEDMEQERNPNPGRYVPEDDPPTDDWRPADLHPCIPWQDDVREAYYAAGLFPPSPL